MASPLPLTIFLFLSLSFSARSDSPGVTSETETHLHFYFHDIVTATKPTAIRVASAPLLSTSITGFGAVVMIDDPLTEGPDEESKLIGRAQGMYALASKEEAGLLMNMNFVFIDGEYNGSTLAVLGRNTVFSDVREMPIIGGSGKFRFARGYALAKTYYWNVITGNAIVEYDVHVLHQ
ncbi:dirigent protein 21-like [Iris pallida]|uniref:Dirigent protein n=1 Tax=Iris pallida TaxID=29817 RepID=A0AAX6E274_IRIPA|nr:dirigent protein 21-like [Iris pallida]KAJ6841350.1 dirigent protein 21-like [Iris pallida]